MREGGSGRGKDCHQILSPSHTRKPYLGFMGYSTGADLSKHIEAAEKTLSCFYCPIGFSSGCFWQASSIARAYVCGHWNENANVERYSFVIQVQARGDGTEGHYANLRVLEGTCNIGESLMGLNCMGNPNKLAREIAERSRFDSRETLASGRAI